MSDVCERCNGHGVVVRYQWEPVPKRIELPCPRCRHEDSLAALDDWEAAR